MQQTFDSLFRQNIQRLHYQVDGGEADKSHVQVIIWPTFSGLSEFEKNVADYIAGLGFSATALDLYGQGRNPLEIDEKKSKMGSLLAQAPLLHGLQAELIQSVGDSLADKTIIHVGFCLGGRLALEAGLHFADSAGVVSFHGLMSFYRAESVEQANRKHKILVLNGYQDPLVEDSAALEARQYWSALGVDFQFLDFGNAVHSFMLPSANNPEQGSQYNALVAQRGYRYLANFLEEFL